MGDGKVRADFDPHADVIGGSGKRQADEFKSHENALRERVKNGDARAAKELQRFLSGVDRLRND